MVEFPVIGAQSELYENNANNVLFQSIKDENNVDYVFFYDVKDTICSPPPILTANHYD